MAGNHLSHRQYYVAWHGGTTQNTYRLVFLTKTPPKSNQVVAVACEMFFHAAFNGRLGLQGSCERVEMFPGDKFGLRSVQPQGRFQRCAKLRHAAHPWKTPDLYAGRSLCQETDAISTRLGLKVNQEVPIHEMFGRLQPPSS